MKKIVVYYSLILLMISIFTALPSSAMIRFGVLPDEAIVPLLVAKEEGIFADNGVDVELALFQTAVERDSALQSGQIDGTISDLLGVAFAVDNEQKIKITSTAKARFTLLAAPDSGIFDYGGLQNVSVAISFNTIAEYVVDKLLEANGVNIGSIEKVAINKIPVRMQMLISGQVKAAVLPEPLGSLAVKNGARVIGTTEEIESNSIVILFKEEVINNRSAEIKNFYRAYSKAIRITNQNHEDYRGLIVDKGRFPARIKNAFKFIDYEQPGLPEAGIVRETLHWLNERRLLKNELAYGDLVERKFISCEVSGAYPCN